MLCRLKLRTEIKRCGAFGNIIHVIPPYNLRKQAIYGQSESLAVIERWLFSKKTYSFGFGSEITTITKG